MPLRSAAKRLTYLVHRWEVSVAAAALASGGTQHPEAGSGGRAASRSAGVSLG